MRGLEEDTQSAPYRHQEEEDQQKTVNNTSHVLPVHAYLKNNSKHALDCEIRIQKMFNLNTFGITVFFCFEKVL